MERRNNAQRHTIRMRNSAHTAQRERRSTQGKRGTVARTLQQRVSHHRERNKVLRRRSCNPGNRDSRRNSGQPPRCHLRMPQRCAAHDSCVPHSSGDFVKPRHRKYRRRKSCDKDSRTLFKGRHERLHRNFTRTLLLYGRNEGGTERCIRRLGPEYRKRTAKTSREELPRTLRRGSRSSLRRRRYISACPQREQSRGRST